ncbi:MAG: hypothetical protein CMO55_21930 [Verrucomicrobiales bacterium]|nr:hypothetical protein [Verrucomicrobiales bacterium]
MKILIHLVLISSLACGTLMAQGNPRVKAAEEAKKAAQNKNGNNNKNGNKNNKSAKEREQAKRQREREREMANNKGGANKNNNNKNKGGANANRNQQANKPAPQPKKADENPRMTVNRPPSNTGNQQKVTSNQNTQSPQAREQAARAAEANARQREKRKELNRKINPQTANYLRDHNRGRGNWEEEQRRHREHAHRIEDKDDADNLIWTILGSAAAGAVVGNIVSKDRTPQRLPYDQVGRTDVERRDSVNYMVNRFQGNREYQQGPAGYNTGGRYGYDDHGHHQPHYYDGNRRVVYYNSREEIPPVLMAYDRLDQVNVSPYQDSPYRYDGGQGGSYYSDLPESYRGRDAYAVSYPVDPNSAMSRDDILFQQGSTDFADAYSYDIVVDMAEAMRSSQLSNKRFIIEGHASAEGDYSSNLRLSQQRAERIARDLVDMGVDPNRLIPVGYGEAEAQYPADYAENYRALDRRVMVFTSAQ